MVSLVKRVLGEYFEVGDEGGLKVSSLGGQAVWTGLRVKEVDIGGVKVTGGTLQRVEVDAPWKNSWRGETVKVRLLGLHLDVEASPSLVGASCSDGRTQGELQKKRSRVAACTAVFGSGTHVDAKPAGWRADLIGRLLCRLARWVVITLQDLSISISYTRSEIHLLAKCGHAALSEMETHTGSQQVNKEIRLLRMQVWCSSECPKPLVEVDSIQGSVAFNVLENDLHAQAEVGSISINCNTNLLKKVAAISLEASRYATRRKFAKSHPHPLTFDARGFWRFSISCVLAEIRKSQYVFDEEALLARRRAREEYLELLRIQKQKGPSLLSPEQRGRLDGLEMALSEQDLISFQLRADFGNYITDSGSSIATVVLGEGTHRSHLTDAERQGFRQYAALSADDITASIIFDHSLATGFSFHLSKCTITFDEWRVELRNGAAQYDMKGVEGSTAVSFATFDLSYANQEVLKSKPRIEEYSLLWSACHKLGEVTANFQAAPVLVHVTHDLGVFAGEVASLSDLKWTVDNIFPEDKSKRDISNISFHLASAQLIVDGGRGIFRVSAHGVQASAEMFGSAQSLTIGCKIEADFLSDSKSSPLLHEVALSVKSSKSSNDTAVNVAVGNAAIYLPSTIFPAMRHVCEELSPILETVGQERSEMADTCEKSNSIQFECSCIEVAVSLETEDEIRLNVPNIIVTHSDLTRTKQGELSVASVYFEAMDGLFKVNLEPSTAEEWDIRWLMTDTEISIESCLESTEIQLVPNQVPQLLRLLKNLTGEQRHLESPGLMEGDSLGRQNSTAQLSFRSDMTLNTVKLRTSDENGLVLAVVCEEVVIRRQGLENEQNGLLLVREVRIDDRRPSCNLFRHIVAPYRQEDARHFMLRVNWNAEVSKVAIHVFAKDCILHVRIPVLAFFASHLSAASLPPESRTTSVTQIQPTIHVHATDLMIVLPHGGESCDTLEIPVQSVVLSHSNSIEKECMVSSTSISAHGATIISLAALDDPSTLGRDLEIKYSVTDALEKSNSKLRVGKTLLNVTQDDYVLINRILHENVLAVTADKQADWSKEEAFEVECPQLTVLLLEKRFTEQGRAPLESTLAELSASSIRVKCSSVEQSQHFTITGDDIKVFDLREDTPKCFRSILSLSGPNSRRAPSSREYDVAVGIQSDADKTKVKIDLAPISICFFRQFFELARNFVADPEETHRGRRAPQSEKVGGRATFIESNIDLWLSAPLNPENPQTTGVLLETTLGFSLELDSSSALANINIDFDLLDFSFCPSGLLARASPKEIPVSTALGSIGAPSSAYRSEGRALLRKGSLGRFPRSGSWVAGNRERRPVRGSILVLRASPSHIAYSRANDLLLSSELLEIQAACCDLKPLSETLMALMETDQPDSGVIVFPDFRIRLSKVTVALFSEAGPLLRSELDIEVSGMASNALTRISGKGCVSMDGFNTQLSLWEPIVEPWHVTTKIELRDMALTVLSIYSEQILLINGSPSILRKLPRAVHEVRFPGPGSQWDQEWEGGGLEPAIYFMNVTGERLVVHLPYCDVEVGDELTYCVAGDQSAEISIAGWEGCVTVPVNQPGNHKGVFKMPNSGPPQSRWNVNVEVQSARNCTLVRIQSDVCIHNTATIELDLLSADNVPFGKIGPGQQKHVPLRLCGHQGGIRFLPYHARHQYHASLPLFPRHVSHAEETRTLTCKFSGHDSSHGARPYVFSVAKKMHVPNTGDIRLVVTGPILVENATTRTLDVEAAFSSGHDAESIFLSPGKASVVLRDPLNLERLSVTDHGKLIILIQFDGKSPSIETTGNMKAEVHVSKGENLKVVLFHQFCLLNNTFGNTPPLVYYQGRERELLGHRQSASLLSESDGSIFDLYLAIGRSPLTKRIDLTRTPFAARKQIIACPDGDCYEFCLDMEQGHGKFYRTRVLTIKAAWTVVNSTSGVSFHFKQQGARSASQRALPPSSSCPLYWDDISQPFAFQLRHSESSLEEWSRPIEVASVEPEVIMALVRHKNGAQTFLRLSVSRCSGGGGTFVFSGPILSLTDVRFHNLSSMIVLIEQRSTQAHRRTEVGPGITAGLVWDFECTSQRLYLCSSKAVDIGHVKIFSDESQNYSFRVIQGSGNSLQCFAKVVHCQSVAHVIFTESRENLISEEQRLKAAVNQSTPLSVTLTLAGVGVSLFGGRPTQELLYAQVDGVAVQVDCGPNRCRIGLSVTNVHIDNFVTSSIGATNVKPLLSKMVAQPLLAFYPLWWNKRKAGLNEEKMITGNVSLAWISDESKNPAAGVVEIVGSFDLHPIEVNIDAALIVSLGEIVSMHQQFVQTVNSGRTQPNPLLRAQTNFDLGVVPHRVFIRSLKISSVVARLSVKVEGGDSRALSRLTGLAMMHALILGNADRAEICLARQAIYLKHTTGPTLSDKLFGLYRVQILYNLYEAVSSLDNMVLSPTRLLLIIRHSAEVVVSRFHRARSGPEAIAGVGRDLLLASVPVVGRTMTKAMAAPDAFLTLWMAVVDMDDTGRVGESFRLAAKGLSMIADGFPGQPSMVGLGALSAGFVGPTLLFTRILRLISSSLDGFLDEFDEAEKPRALRPPRAFTKEGGILPYRFEREELGNFLIKAEQNARFEGESYLFFALSAARSGVLVSSHRISLFNKGAAGKWSLGWTCFLADISSVGRRSSTISVVTFRNRVTPLRARLTKGLETESVKTLGNHWPCTMRTIAPEILYISCLNEWTAASIALELSTTEREGAPTDSTVVFRHQ